MSSSSSHHLCNDLLVLIFERLPSKSVIRFRTLSKYWHSRLATPEFIRNHRLQSPPKVLIRHGLHPGFVGSSEYRDVYTLHSGDRLPLDGGSAGYVDIPGVELPRKYAFCRPSIVGSCNGILCVLDGNDISLWNLSIRRRLIVPDNPSSRSFSTSFAVGLGFDPITDDYNVVTVSYTKKFNFDENSAFIYSLRRETWSAIPSRLPRIYEVDSPKACLFNGVLHWVVKGYLTTVTTVENRRCFILSYDLSSHVFGEILLPHQPAWRTRQLTTINGCLAVMTDDCKIWVMKEYGEFESWCVLYEPPVTSVLDQVKNVFQPIVNGDTLAYDKQGSDEVYNLETRLRRKVAQFTPYGSMFDQMEAYVESLELIDKQHAATCGETVNPF